MNARKDEVRLTGVSCVSSSVPHLHYDPRVFDPPAYRVIQGADSHARIRPDNLCLAALASDAGATWNALSLGFRIALKARAVSDSLGC